MQINVQKTGTPIDSLIAEILNDASFARPDHIRSETPFPEISSSWPSHPSLQTESGARYLNPVSSNPISNVHD